MLSKKTKNEKQHIYNCEYIACIEQTKKEVNYLYASIFSDISLRARLLWFYTGKSTELYIKERRKASCLWLFGETELKNKNKWKNRPGLSFYGCQQPYLRPVSPPIAAGAPSSMTVGSGEEKNAEASSANSGTFLPRSRLTQQNWPGWHGRGTSWSCRWALQQGRNPWNTAGRQAGFPSPSGAHRLWSAAASQAPLAPITSLTSVPRTQRAEPPFVLVFPSNATIHRKHFSFSHGSTGFETTAFHIWLPNCQTKVSQAPVWALQCHL